MSIQRQYYFSFGYLLLLVALFWATYSGMFGPKQVEIDVEGYRSRLNFTGVLLDLEGLQNGDEIRQRVEQEDGMKGMVRVWVKATEAEAGKAVSVMQYRSCVLDWAKSEENRECKIKHMSNTEYQRMRTQVLKITQGPIVLGKYLFLQTLSPNSYPPPLRTLSNLLPHTRVLNHRLTQSQLQTNSRQFLKTPNPLRLIDQLLSSRYNRACAYTHLECQSHIFLILDGDKVTTKNGVTVVSSQNLETAVVDWLRLGFEGDQLGKARLKEWGKRQLVRVIGIYQQELRHLDYIADRKEEFFITKQTIRLLDQWASQANQIFRQTSSFPQNINRIWSLRLNQVRLLTDKRIGQANLFPEDYKIGVYLPLVVPIVYSLIYVFKSMLKFM